jgi:hypothetical protein
LAYSVWASQEAVTQMDMGDTDKMIVDIHPPQNGMIISHNLIEMEEDQQTRIDLMKIGTSIKIGHQGPIFNRLSHLFQV